jgi:hypothetical protein
MTPNPITDNTLNAADKSLLTFMASASRPLKVDAAVSPLAAFDTLQTVYKRFQKQWLIVWIVCMDGFADITPTKSIQDAVDAIEQHGGAAGIVGLAVIAGSFRFLKKPLRAGAKVHGLLDRSGNAAADRFLKLLEPIAAEAKFLREQMEDPKQHS